MMRTSAYGLGLVMALTFPIASQAERPDDRLYIAPSIVYSDFDEDKKAIDSSIGFSLGVGKSITETMDAELVYHSTGTDNNAGADVDISGIGLNVFVFKDRETSGRYTVGGIAANDIDGTLATGGNGTGSTTSVHYDIGVGYLFGAPQFGPFKSILSKDAKLRADVRYRTDVLQSGPYAHDIVLTVGMKLPIGTSKRAEEEAAAAAAATAAALARLEADDDNDGVPNVDDKCGNTAKGTKVDKHGCAKDGDADGVTDDKDQCPGTKAGVAVNAEGCPLDGDGDGVLDSKDQCPKTPAGLKVMADGCALEGDCRIPLPGQKIDENGCAIVDGIILRGVTFEFDRARLTPNATDILDSITDVLLASSVKFEIGGHTDSLGDETYNKQLSKRRADAVVDYLAGRGIEKDRMTSKGYGQDDPIADNSTEEGRELNRRVQLRVTK